MRMSSRCIPHILAVACISALTISVTSMSAFAACPNPAAVGADYNGDCKADILWRNTQDGENAMWLMNGFNFLSTAWLAPIWWDMPNWQIVGTGDFDGDGKTDILWWNASTGQLGIWFMNGTSFKYYQDISYIVTDTNWQVAGVGDFNGDGKADILWRDQSTGQVGIWLMDAATIASSQIIWTVSDLNWQIEGVGDFNGDGYADIFWRNKSTGQNGVWLMNGFTISLAGMSYTVTDQNWQVAGVGDFNGDGKSDLLWTDSATGQVGIWLMNGTNYASYGFAQTTVAPGWNAVQVGDFNGDGKSDILWRNKVTGENAIWLMDSFNWTSAQFIYQVSDTDWNAY